MRFFCIFGLRLKPTTMVGVAFLILGCIPPLAAGPLAGLAFIDILRRGKGWYLAPFWVALLLVNLLVMFWIASSTDAWLSISSFTACFFYPGGGHRHNTGNAVCVAQAGSQRENRCGPQELVFHRPGADPGIADRRLRGAFTLWAAVMQSGTGGLPEHVVSLIFL